MGVTIRQALVRVSNNWKAAEQLDWLDQPVHDLIGYTLFDVANSANGSIRGSVTRATRAQKIILNRMVGLRRPGSRPVTKNDDGLEFQDLTAGALE